VIGSIKSRLPSPANCGLALVSAVLLTLAFPDFELWFLAWFALVPLMWAIEREVLPDGSLVQQCARAFLVGWVFGTAFFFGTCWWLTYAPIHYAAIPWPIAYGLILIACVGAGIFPGVFAATLAVLIRRFGSWAFLAAPFVWVFSEFLRYWVTGNNWNAIGYSQALVNSSDSLLNLAGVSVLWTAEFGGVLLVSSIVVLVNIPFWMGTRVVASYKSSSRQRMAYAVFLASLVPLVSVLCLSISMLATTAISSLRGADGTVVALQPNVPMKSLTPSDFERLRDQQIAAAESELRKLPNNDRLPTTVILPESPMNFAYNDDPEFQSVIGDFARRNRASVLFNSMEPDRTTMKYFNSAVMVGPDGSKLAQYDKIFLLPFGEAVPSPLDAIMPAFVGTFAYGSEYDLLSLGDAKAGVMICFESHFGQLSREYVRNGADALIEMTNDGYLGPTPVLRQHLANAVFRAVETKRPVLRVTNVGITAYINERGQVLDEAPAYTEAARAWNVAKSDGSQTFYVRYGDWFAWLCSAITVSLLIFIFVTRRRKHSAV
jgi:apolipoprotein N-acyltransferase